MLAEIKQKIELLTQPVWTVDDIMVYFNQKVKSKPSAYRIKNMARDVYDGRTNLGKQYVKRDSVIRCFGSTTENELKNLKALIKNEEEL